MPQPRWDELSLAQLTEQLHDMNQATNASNRGSTMSTNIQHTRRAGRAYLLTFVVSMLLWAAIVAAVWMVAR